MERLRCQLTCHPPPPHPQLRRWQGQAGVWISFHNCSWGRMYSHGTCKGRVCVCYLHCLCKLGPVHPWLCFSWAYLLATLKPGWIGSWFLLSIPGQSWLWCPCCTISRSVLCWPVWLLDHSQNCVGPQDCLVTRNLLEDLIPFNNEICDLSIESCGWPSFCLG